MVEDDEQMWFFDLSKQLLMHHMPRECKVNASPTTFSDTVPGVPLTQSDLNKSKLEAAWQMRSAMQGLGKPPLALMPMAVTAQQTVTIGGTMMTVIPSTAMTTPAPTVATPTPTMTMVAAPVMAPKTMHVTSHALQFDKGGHHSSSKCGKFQNCEQWSKWHPTLMGSAHEHKCEQVLDEEPCTQSQ